MKRAMFRPLCLWLLLQASSLPAQNNDKGIIGAVRCKDDNAKVHIYAYYDTSDVSLREDLTADKRNLSGSLRAGLSKLGTALRRQDLLRWVERGGKAVTREQILHDLDNATVSPTDTLMFFYGGHGSIDEKGHALPLATGSTVYRSEILERMMKKNPRLVIIITDCCAVVEQSNSLPYRGKDTIDPLVPREYNVRILWNLFVQHRGLVDINSSSPGESAWGLANTGNEQKGGIFTTAFTDLLFSPTAVLDDNNNGFVEWDEFFAHLKKATNNTYGSMRRRVLDANPNDRKLATQHIQTPWSNSLPRHLRLGMRVVTDPRTNKVRIEEIIAGLPASKAGLRPGQYVLEVNDRPITNDKAFGFAVDQHKKALSGPIRLKIENRPQVVQIEPAY
jgi:hypothetical protein